MALWYFLLKGRPHGPVVQEEIEQQIKAGHIHAQDLLYLEHDTQWREAQSYPAYQHFFTSSIQKKPTGPQWVLLARKADGSGYRQKGPFTQEQILAFLQRGDITYTDYVWREGLKEWYKILALPELNRPIEEADTFKKQLPPLPTEEELPNPEDKTAVTEPEKENTDTFVTGDSHPWAEKTQKIPDPEPDDEPRPVEKRPAAPPAQDFTRRARVERVIRRSRAKAKSEQAVARRMTLFQWFSELRSVKKSVVVVSLLGLVWLIVMAVVLPSSYWDQKNLKLRIAQQDFVPPNVRSGKKTTPPPQAEINTENQKGGAAVASPTKSVEAPTSPVVPVNDKKIAPQYVRLQILNNGSENAQVKIESNASRHYTVRLTFMADGGDILLYPSYFRTFRYTKLEDRQIEVQKLALPSGRYQVRAEIEDLSDQAEVSFATNTGNFQEQIMAMRKWLLFAHNDERYGFFKTVTRLEKEAFRLSQSASLASNLSSWATFYKKWRRDFERITHPTLTRISSKNRNEYVHSEKWLKLKDVRAKIDSASKSMNRSRQRGQAIDAQVAKELATELSKLKEAILQASLFKQ